MNWLSLAWKKSYFIVAFNVSYHGKVQNFTLQGVSKKYLFPIFGGVSGYRPPEKKKTFQHFLSCRSRFARDDRELWTLSMYSVWYDRVPYLMIGFVIR